MARDLPYEALLAQIAKVVNAQAKGAVKVLLFGSIARRDAQESSDVDLLLVWPASIDEDDQWEASQKIAHGIHQATQRICLPLIYTEGEYCDMPLSSPRLAEALSRDAIDLMEYAG